MKENSETGYIFSTKIRELLEGERILGALSRQLLVKNTQEVTHEWSTTRVHMT